MYLEQVSTGEIVSRLDKKPDSSIFSSLQIEQSLELNTSIEADIDCPSIDINIEDPSVSRLNEFRIWRDQQKTKFVSSLVIKETDETIYGDIKTGFYKVVSIKGNDFKDLMDRTRFTIYKSNISFRNLIIDIVSKGGEDWGISTDYSNIKEINIRDIARVELIYMTAMEMLNKLYEYGISWYVDKDKKVHAWDNTNRAYAFDDGGIIINDNTNMVCDFRVGRSVNSNISNVVKIMGAKKKSRNSITRGVIGTGNPVTGLDFGLEHNPFTGDYFVEEWNSLDDNSWIEVDPGGNIKMGHDGQGYLFISNGKLVCWGGTGSYGTVGIYRSDFFEYSNDGYISTSLKVDNNGEAYVCGLLDGNGINLSNVVMGFKIDSNKITKVVLDGNEVTPDTVVDIDPLIEASISSLDSSRTSFNIDPAYSPYLSAGDTAFLQGDNLGVVYVTIKSVVGNIVTITNPLPASADVDASSKLYRDPWYNLRILFNSDNIQFQVQGQNLGPYGSPIWTTIHETPNTFDIPDFVYMFEIISKDLKVYFERMVHVPPEQFSLILDNGTVYSISPEEYAQASASQAIIYQGKDDGNPPRLSFRSSPFIASVVSNAANSTTKIYYDGKTSDDTFMSGDIVMINGERSYVESNTPSTKISGAGYITLDANYALSSKPKAGDTIYPRTTMLEAGEGAILTYHKEIDNAHIFKDEASISVYGECCAEPILDERLTTFLDIEARAESFLEFNAYPRISGNFYMHITENTPKLGGFLLSSYNIPVAGQYMTIASSKRGISDTIVRINRVLISLEKDDILRCDVEFNREAFDGIVLDKRLARRTIELVDRTKYLFQSQKNTDDIKITTSAITEEFREAQHGAHYYDGMQHDFY